MSLFCLCTSIGVFFDYLLTFTLLAPIIICTTPKYNTQKNVGILEVELAEETNFIKEKTLPNGAVKLPLKNIPEDKISKWVLIYAKFLNSNFARILAFILLILIYIISTFGLLQMRSTFEPSKAFPSDSPLATSLEGIRSIFYYKKISLF